MTLSAGSKLAHYEISNLLGKGGMGEVYKARDQKLGRDVAIKALPEEFAKDTGRVARFQREAKLLASVNHPNIAAIHGVEESDGTHFLVLELVEGDTLSDRLKHGAIPVDETLNLALQIAEALEAAHEKGVIHRDLKPANIKVTPDGKVKVLDFGLAKAFAGDSEDRNLSNSPTLSVAATQQGVILGTAAYMSPEQARGKSIDKRTDIWAFGVVLFEMLSGKALFSGEDVSSTLARVLERTPDFSILPPKLHPKLVEMLERCLEKEVNNRYGSISDARVDIQRVLADPNGIFMHPAAGSMSKTGLRKMLPWIVSAVILIALAAGWIGFNLKTSSSVDDRDVVRFRYEIPEEQQPVSLVENILAVSPDGKQIVYSTSDGLYLRYLDELNARPIPGTEGETSQPFFSPDGQWIGYWCASDDQIKKISIHGGVPVPIAEGRPQGFLSWDIDETIVYCLRGVIMRVSANGGTPERIAEFGPEGELVNSPQILPGGKFIIFTIFSEPNKVMALSLESGERKELLEGDNALYLPSGHIVYTIENDLFAVRFDIDTLEVSGGHFSVIRDVYRGIHPHYAVSQTGTLVYMPKTAEELAGGTMVWVDREGNEEKLNSDRRSYSGPRISPDGTQVAVCINNSGYLNIHIWDTVRESWSQLTFHKASATLPLWSPDGKRVAFSSSRGQGHSIYWRAADGSGEAELLIPAKNQMLLPGSWSSDGNSMAINELPLGTRQFDIGVASIEGDGEPRLLLQEEYDEYQPQISPDVRWMAYSSNESGRAEIIVHPYPDVNSGHWKVSTEGGSSPLWSPDGKKLFYRSGDSVMEVAVDVEQGLAFGKPRVLFRGPYLSHTSGEAYRLNMWDIHPNGKKFLMIKESFDDDSAQQSAQAEINIVVNWFEELRERVPVN